MDGPRTEDAPIAALRRYSVTIPEDLVKEAKPTMRAKHVRSFSDYVTRLIQDDVTRQRLAAQEVAP